MFDITFFHVTGKADCSSFLSEPTVNVAQGFFFHSHKGPLIGLRMHELSPKMIYSSKFI